jgi:WD40 repeat protein
MPTDDPKRFDAFLSYNSLDLPVVRDLYERLQRGGLEPYLEREEVAPGDVFQRKLAEGLHASKSCVVFLGPNGLGPWQKEELQVAIDRRVRDEAFRVIPVLLPGAERPRRGDVAHLEFLLNASWVEFLKTLDDERAFRSLVWGITGEKPREPDAQYEGKDVCPYRGLEPFRPEDAKFFFGRENLTGWLVSALRREVRAAQGVRFLGVLGPSGSGKSSLVLAGLVPRLKEGAIEGSERWPVVIVRPGDDPLERLTEKVVPALRAVRPDPSLSELGEQNDLLTILRAEGDSASALNRYVGLKFASEPDDRRLVIVTDQFEEVFTYRPQDEQARARFEKDRDRFFANLLLAAAAPAGRVVVVLTMRSDFLSACASFPQLAAVLSAHQELVGPMTVDELREAIERPAFRVGCEVELGLSERLLADVAGRPGALPLLQFALTEVWKKREVRRLTLRAYTELGKDDKGEQRGIEGVLDRRANEIYRNLQPEDQELCRRLFLRLVQPGEGTEDTKRRVSYHELLPNDPARAEAVRRLVRTLADRDARLVTTEGGDAAEGAVEVAHEALVRGWTQLRRWVDAERTNLRTQRRLTAAAREWEAAKPEDKGDYLYSGVRLAVCREWGETHRDELNPTEAAFLDASEKAEKKREQHELENERRLREAAEARKREALAAAERQSQLGFRFLVAAVVAAALAITAGGLAWWANKEAQDAKAKARTSESRRIAALSDSERDKHLDLALLLADEAVETENTFEARNSLFRALLARPGLTSFLHADEGWVQSVAFSPDGRTLAAGYSSGVVGGVVLWEVGGHARLQDQPLAVAEGRVWSVAFSPDGKTLAAGYDAGGGGVVLWDVGRQSRPRLDGKPLAVPEGDVQSVSFSPDGKTLAAGYGRVGKGGGGVVLWEVGGHARLQDQPLAVAEGDVTSVAFSPDGKTLATGYNVFLQGGGVVLWDVWRRARLPDQPLAVAEGRVSSVSFSPDGRTLAAGYRRVGVGGGMVLWEMGGRVRLPDQPLAVAEGNVESVSFSPDGTTLAAGYSRVGVGGGVVLWEVGGRARLQDQPLAVAEGDVTSVSFSPDGKTLAAGYGRDGVGGVVLWELGGRARLQAKPLAVAEGYVFSVSFSPDGKTLAAGYSRGGEVEVGGVVLWEVGRHARLQDQPLAVAEGDGYSVSFSPDGKTLAAGYGRGVHRGGGVVLWDVDLYSWRLHARQIANRNFTPAERRQFFPDRPEDQRTVREPARAARRE